MLQRSHSVGLNEWTVVHLGGQRGECVQRAVEHRKIAVDGLACLDRSGGSLLLGSTPPSMGVPQAAHTKQSLCHILPAA